MRIGTADYLALRRRIVRSLHGLYPQRRDILEAGAAAFARQRDPFAASAHVVPVADVAGTCCALLVHHGDFPHLQVAYFEASDGCSRASVQELLDDARVLARERGLADVVAGMNGHLAHGVGYLLDHHDAPVPLDVVHTPSWYSELWLGLMPVRSEGFHSYQWNTSELRAFFTDERVARFERGIRIRTSVLRNWKDEVETLTRLMNASADDMPLYFPKTGVQNYYLMKDLPWVIEPHNLLFAVDEAGAEVGYVFWYDDRLELLPPGHGNAIEWVLRSKVAGLRGWQPRRFVINAIAVDPRHKGRGTSYALLHRAAQLTRSPVGESTFIADANRLSSTLGSRTGGIQYKHYGVYWFDL